MKRIGWVGSYIAKHYQPYSVWIVGSGRGFGYHYNGLTIETSSRLNIMYKNYALSSWNINE